MTATTTSKENVGETVLGAIIDGLGIPGWELQFWEYGVEEDDELVLAEYERRVVEIRASLS